MSLPKWNRKWEKRDPLRGRLGWSLHHYVSVVVVTSMLVIVFALWLSMLAKARRHEDRTKLMWELRTGVRDANGEP